MRRFRLADGGGESHFQRMYISGRLFRWAKILAIMTGVTTITILGVGLLFGGSNTPDVVILTFVSGALAALFLLLVGALFRVWGESPSN